MDLAPRQVRVSAVPDHRVAVTRREDRVHGLARAGVSVTDPGARVGSVAAAAQCVDARRAGGSPPGPRCSHAARRGHGGSRPPALRRGRRTRSSPASPGGRRSRLRTSHALARHLPAGGPGRGHVASGGSGSALCRTRVPSAPAGIRWALAASVRSLAVSLRAARRAAFSTRLVRNRFSRSSFAIVVRFLPLDATSVPFLAVQARAPRAAADGLGFAVPGT